MSQLQHHSLVTCPQTCVAQIWRPRRGTAEAVTVLMVGAAWLVAVDWVRRGGHDMSSDAVGRPCRGWQTSRRCPPSRTSIWATPQACSAYLVASGRRTAHRFRHCTLVPKQRVCRQAPSFPVAKRPADAVRDLSILAADRRKRNLIHERCWSRHGCQRWSVWGIAVRGILRRPQAGRQA
jgi:hypothetical protein